MRFNALARRTVLAAAVGLTACDLGTTNGDGGRGGVAIAFPVQFSNGSVQAQRAENGGGLDRIDAKIVVKSTGEVLLEKTLNDGSPEVTSANQSSADPVVTLRFRLPQGGETEVFTITLAGFLNGVQLYSVGPVDFTLGQDGRAANVQAQATYVGPGNNVTSVALSPRTITMAIGQTMPFSCVGMPGSVTNFPYTVETTNEAIASVQSTTSVHGIAIGNTELVCRLGFGSHAEDHIPVIVTGGPTLTVASGGGQTGTVNTLLGSPIVIQAKNGDGSNASGIVVSFTTTAGNGTTNPTSATTDGSGHASTSWTLGTATGNQIMRASAVIQGTNVSVDVLASASATAQTGTVSGTVQASGGAAISGATVEIRAGANNTAGNPLATTTSSASGAFTFDGLTAGAYTLHTVATNFGADVRNVTVTAGQTTNVTIQLAPTGGIRGVVTSVLSAPIANATVELRLGSLTTGTPLRTTTTGPDGTFEIKELSSGAYTLTVIAAGFVTDTRSVTVTAPSTTNLGISLAPTGGAPAIQITLDWNTAEDLDAHLMLPNNQPFVFWGQEGSCASICLASQDDIDGFGPETINFTAPFTGDLFFNVHHYDACEGASSALTNSGAIVRVRINGVVQHTFNVPNQVGTNWAVFRINGTTVTPINTIGLAAPPYVACSPFVAGGAGAGALRHRMPKTMSDVFRMNRQR